MVAPSPRSSRRSSPRPRHATRPRCRRSVVAATAIAALGLTFAVPASASSPSARSDVAAARDIAVIADAGHTLSAAASGSAASVASSQLTTVAKLAAVPANTLQVHSVLADVTGLDVNYQQTAAGLPVHGGSVVASFDRSGHVLAVNGRLSAMHPTRVAARTTAATAVNKGLQHVQSRFHLDSTALRSTGSHLEWYDPSLSRTGNGAAQLVHTIDVLPQNGGAVHGQVLVAAGNNAVVADETVDGRGITRAVCDLRNWFYIKASTCTWNQATRREGGAAASVADVNQAYDQFGYASSFYSSQLGVDLTDMIGFTNGGHKYLAANVRVCEVIFSFSCPMQNAYWDGQGMGFGQGFATADDVITHELTHGVTQHVNNLQYGAMNEGMSDIMGEFEDQIDGVGNDAANVKWLIGEDLPASIGWIRNMANPPASREAGPHPDRIGSPDFKPDGEVHGMSGPMSKTAYLISDGGTFNGQTITGLGLAKSIKLWWKVEKTLTSTSQYKSLNTTLAAACTTLQSEGTLTADDCAQVTKARTATELTKATK